MRLDQDRDADEAHDDTRRATEEWSRRLAGAFDAFNAKSDPDPYAAMFARDVVVSSSSGPSTPVVGGGPVTTGLS